uniref:Uncharacterized protein n=1 Tax=Leptobrachium leishanense TaxID=445787 RepID=A0A8C5QZC4_9ANUR
FQMCAKHAFAHTKKPRKCALQHQRSSRTSLSELLLVWKIEIDEKGAVIPILDLLPKIPEQGKTTTWHFDTYGFILVSATVP